jgi:tRNA uridine 5-carbamoylmethylation protein Kti12
MRNKTAKLYIIRGLPGSGKSTFAEKILDKGLADSHYEADMYFLDKDGNYRYDPSKISSAHSWCRANVLKDLKKGLRVIVSNTFTRRNEMLPYIQYCIDNDISFEVIRMKTQFQNIHDVPEEVLKKMKNRFQDYSGETIITG